jgi:hypothetical protein
MFRILKHVPNRVVPPPLPASSPPLRGIDALDVELEADSGAGGGAGPALL